MDAISRIPTYCKAETWEFYFSFTRAHTSYKVSLIRSPLAYMINVFYPWTCKMLVEVSTRPLKIEYFSP